MATMQIMLKELFASLPGTSAITRADNPGCTFSSSDVFRRSHELVAADGANQKVQCRYHMTVHCDCDRYFARPGTAEYGC
jgi:hypothetical protein